jgi:hypothetical protein
VNKPWAIAVYANDSLFYYTDPTLTHPAADLVASLITRTKAVLTFLLWHQRYNHMTYQRLWDLINQGYITGFPFNINVVVVAALPVCRFCRLWLLHRNTLPSSHAPIADPIRPGVYFAVDMKKFSVTFLHGYNAFVVIVDGFSHFYWLYWIKVPDPDHSNVFLDQVLKPFYQEVCIPNHYLHFTLHPDNAATFVSRDVQHFCTEVGITLDPSVPYKPSTNGLAEAAVKVVASGAVVSLNCAKLPQSLYPFAANNAVRTHNRTPHGPDNKAPCERLDGTLSTGEDLRTFGAQVYIYDDKASSARLQAKGQPARFLQYKRGHQTTIIAWNETTKKVNEHGTGNAVFNETNLEALVEDMDINEELLGLEELAPAIHLAEPDAHPSVDQEHPDKASEDTQDTSSSVHVSYF